MENSEQSTKRILTPIAHFAFNVEMANDPQNTLFRRAKEMESDIRAEIEALALDVFGKDITVSDMTLREGSIDLSFNLNAYNLKTFLDAQGHQILGYALSSWLLFASRAQGLYQGMVTLKTLVSSMLKKKLAPPPAAASSVINVGAVFHVNPGIALAPSAPNQRLLWALLGYLAVSHAALLALLGWLLVTHMK